MVLLCFFSQEEGNEHLYHLHAGSKAFQDATENGSKNIIFVSETIFNDFLFYLITLPYALLSYEQFCDSSTKKKRDTKRGWL